MKLTPSTKRSARSIPLLTKCFCVKGGFTCTAHLQIAEKLQRKQKEIEKWKRKANEFAGQANRLHRVKTPRLDLAVLAGNIARGIMSFGDGPTPCKRLQFMGGEYPHAEINQGGVVEDALEKRIKECLEQHFA